MDRWSLWLHDADADLSHTRPTGGLPETAQTQLNDFFVLKAEIEQNREPFQSHLDTVDHYLEANPGSKESWVAQRSEHLKKKWSQVQEKIADKEQKLRIALSDAEQLHGEIESMCVWLSSVEAQLTQLEPISRIPDPLEKQILSHAEFQQEVSAHRELMIDMHSKGTKLQYYCEKKDAIPIKNLLVSMKHRFDKIVSRSADRSRQLDSAFQEARLFFDAYAELSSWINESDKIMNQQTVEATGDKLREALDRHKEFQRELASRQPMYDTVCKRGRALEEHAPRSEQSSISEKVENLRQIWTHLCNLSVQRQRDIEEALLASGRFDEALSSLRDWLSIQLPSLRSAKDEKLKGDLDTVSQSIELQKGLESELESKRASLKSVQQHAEQVRNFFPLFS
ncbi:hypothetical protein AB6A40_011225 [Gnathostoma spinigerum]|uniref:Spectrin alpha chain-like protein n=1 Tax=Gnathostoma spinigerum TaxID=75299 RepID=A0ABD6EX79_9BILA